MTIQGIPPLNWNTPLVDPKTGNPSPQFMILWQQMFGNSQTIDGDVTDLATLVAGKADKSITLTAAAGLTGGGDLSANRSFAVGAGTGITVGADAVNLADTAVTPGSYTAANITVDQQGRLTAAANGSSGSGALTLIETRVLGSASASETFSSLGSYEDLFLSWLARGDASSVSNVDMYLRFNADSGTNYDYEIFHYYSTGLSAAQTTAQTAGKIANIAAATATANHASRGEVTIPKYRRTTFFKQAYSEFVTSLGTGTFTQGRGAYGLNWRNTAAITSLTLLPNSGNFIAGTVFSLYGRG